MILIIRYIALGLATFLVGTIGSFLFLFRPRHYNNTYYASHILGYMGQIILGTKVILKNPENFKTDQSVVYLCNHQSNFDLFLCSNGIQKRTVTLGKKSLLFLPIFGVLYWLAGNILIDRSNKKKAWKTMKKIQDSLQNKNKCIWIFPEGTRSKGKGLLPFKRGAFLTAIKSKVPIIPLCMEPYTNKIDIGRLKNPNLTLSALEPIETKNYTEENVNELVELVHSKMTTELTILNAKPAR